MFKVRTFCLILLIPLLLDLLVFFTLQPMQDESQTRFRQSCEDVQTAFRELEERSEEEEEEDEYFFGRLLASSQLCLYALDFQRLEPAVWKSSMLPTRSLGWKMPLRI